MLCKFQAGDLWVVAKILYLQLEDFGGILEPVAAGFVDDVVALATGFLVTTSTSGDGERFLDN